MGTNNNERLTSPEIANLWTHYIRETMAICISKYMMKCVTGPDIHKIFQTALEMSNKHIRQMKDLFKQEKFPVPKGFTEQDVNVEAPPLFTEAFCLSYLHTMTNHGAQGYGIAFNSSIRKDIRDFYFQCNIDTMDMYNLSLEVLGSRKLLNKPPFFLTPDKVQTIHNLSYVTDVFGERRNMNAIESGNIYFNMEKSMLAKASLSAFKQVCKDDDVEKFLDKCISIKNKHIGVFGNLLLKEDLHSARTMDSEITNSQVAPFSDKLMLFHSGFLIAAAISYYGAAAVASMRADIAFHCERAILDDLLVYGSFGKIMIKKGWIEQPPFADDRKILSN